MKVRNLFIYVMIVFSISSCEWARKQMGMPSSDEIAQMKSYMNQVKEDSLRNDSIQNAQLADSSYDYAEEDFAEGGNNSQAVTEDSNSSDLSGNQLDKNFYIIVGSFKVKSNAEKLLSKALDLGYDAKIIPFKNGFDAVSVGSYDNINEARKQMQKVIESGAFVSKEKVAENYDSYTGTKDSEYDEIMSYFKSQNATSPSTQSQVWIYHAK